MMQPPPPMSGFEEAITQSYQMLNQARMQSGVMHQSTTFCIDRCLDTEELYTLLRTTQAPISYRLKTDLEEKKCVQNCSSKWDELLQGNLRETNRIAVADVQNNAIMAMLQQQQGMMPS